MQIIVINGSAESGKNQFIELVREQAMGLGWMIFEHSTIETVKDMMKRYMGYPGDDVREAKTDKARQCMSDIKDAWTAYCDGPFNEIVTMTSLLEDAAITACHPVEKSSVFFHVREPEEIQKIIDFFGSRAMTVLIDAKKRVLHTPANHADQNTHNFNYDVIINNDGDVSKLEDSAKSFLLFKIIQKNP